MDRPAVIVIGGAAVDPRVVARLPAGALVVAADSGLDHALALGLPVALVVGDLDSVTSRGLAAARRAGIEIRRYPPDKDATDTELALEAATREGCDHLVVVSGGNRRDDDRLDHDLGGLLALAHPGLAPAQVEAWWGPAHVGVLRGPGTVELAADHGPLVSLLPVHGPAVGVTTEGLRFLLEAETLGPGTSRGISNELATALTARARVHLERGTLLVISPLALGGAS